eukprot:tig00021493_g21883.t1
MTLTVAFESSEWLAAFIDYPGLKRQVNRLRIARLLRDLLPGDRARRTSVDLSESDAARRPLSHISGGVALDDAAGSRPSDGRRASLASVSSLDSAGGLPAPSSAAPRKRSAHVVSLFSHSPSAASARRPPAPRPLGALAWLVRAWRLRRVARWGRRRAGVSSLEEVGSVEAEGAALGALFEAEVRRAAAFFDVLEAACERRWAALSRNAAHVVRPAPLAPVAPPARPPRRAAGGRGGGGGDAERAVLLGYGLGGCLAASRLRDLLVFFHRGLELVRHYQILTYVALDRVLRRADIGAAPPGLPAPARGPAGRGGGGGGAAAAGAAGGGLLLPLRPPAPPPPRPRLGPPPDGAGRQERLRGLFFAGSGLATTRELRLTVDARDRPGAALRAALFAGPALLAAAASVGLLAWGDYAAAPAPLRALSLPLFRGPLAGLLFAWLYAAVLYACQLGAVNVPFLLDVPRPPSAPAPPRPSSAAAQLDARTAITHVEVIEIASGLSALWAVSLALFLAAASGTFRLAGVPAPASRWALVRALLRGLGAFLYPVKFLDFLVAEVLTSFAGPLADLQVAACFYLFGGLAGGGGSCTDPRWRAPVASAVPFLVRAAQCLRRLHDARREPGWARWQHLANVPPGPTPRLHSGASQGIGTVREVRDGRRGAAPLLPRPLPPRRPARPARPPRAPAPRRGAEDGAEHGGRTSMTVWRALALGLAVLVAVTFALWGPPRPARPPHPPLAPLTLAQTSPSTGASCARPRPAPAARSSAPASTSSPTGPAPPTAPASRRCLTGGGRQVYYAAMCGDGALRALWAAQVAPFAFLAGGHLVATLAAFLEAARRAAWCLFRFENEHAGHIEQYHAHREIPVPFVHSADEEAALWPFSDWGYAGVATCPHMPGWAHGHGHHRPGPGGAPTPAPHSPASPLQGRGSVRASRGSTDSELSVVRTQLADALRRAEPRLPRP